MSILDKVVAAVTPMESDEDRRQARALAQKAAAPGDWLDTILKHHVQIESAFAAALAAAQPTERQQTLRALALILTGHSIAEEAVIYPAMAIAGEKSHATTAYTEQSAAKMQMGELESIDPMSQEYRDKLEHVRGAVLHHMYEEESNWFRDLKQRRPAAEGRLSERYLEEFNRYMHDSPGRPAAATPVYRTA